MIKFIVAGATLAAAAAGAQTAGNPPGNTLAPATGAVSTAPAPVPAAPVGDMGPAKTPAELKTIKYNTEVVCKTTGETGSLIAKHKTCLTRKQWQYVADENQREAYKFVQDNTTRQGGP